MNKYICVVCHKESEGYGNNPFPLKTEGRCCNECNRKVILLRMIFSGMSGK